MDINWERYEKDLAQAEDALSACTLKELIEIGKPYCASPASLERWELIHCIADCQAMERQLPKGENDG